MIWSVLLRNYAINSTLYFSSFSAFTRRVQVKVIWSVLLRNYDIELLQPLNAPDYDAMVVGPKGPCRIRYKRRAAPLA